MCRALEVGHRLVAQPRVDPQRMQGQVLQPLVNCDLVWSNRLRAVAKQDFRGFRLFFAERTRTSRMSSREIN